MIQRILIVDDSPIELRKVENFIRKSLPQIDVLTAGGGQDALDAVEAQMVDLILTDLNMPGMDGLQLVETLKDRHPEISIVLMTAFGNEQLAMRALAAGAASYVPKKELANVLIPTLANVLALSLASRKRSYLKTRQLRDTATFVLENDLSLVEPLVSMIQERIMFMRTAAHRDVTRVGVALHEAIANAIYHGNLEIGSDLRRENDALFYLAAEKRRKENPYVDRRVYVTIDIVPDEARFSIRDEGPGFDAKLVMNPNRHVDLERTTGRGLLLIGSFMDVVYHNALGNEINFVMYSDRSRLQVERRLQRLCGAGRTRVESWPQQCGAEASDIPIEHSLPAQAVVV